MRWLKRDAVVLMVYGVLTLIMTFPTLHYITNSVWLADSIHDPDAYIKLWDMWYVDKMMTGEGQFFYTNTLFYPDGLDLTYHTFHVPHIALTAFLKPFTGLIGAFNLLGILFTWITAYSGYQLLRELLPPSVPPTMATRPLIPPTMTPPLVPPYMGGNETPHPLQGVGLNTPQKGQGVGSNTPQKGQGVGSNTPQKGQGVGSNISVYAAFYGGCVFGFSQWVVYHFRHPDLSLLAVQAWTLLCFIRACRTQQKRWAIGAGILLGLTAYMGMYLVVITLLMVGCYFLYCLLIELVKSDRQRFEVPLPLGGEPCDNAPGFRVRAKKIIRYVNLWVIFLIVMAIIAAPRVLPMVSGNLSFVLTDKYAQYFAWESVDLIQFFVPAYQPLLKDMITLPEDAQRYHMFYLGWLPLGLTLFALIRAESRRKMLFWFGLLLFFMWLSLGAILNINGVMYSNVPMLKPLLDNLPVLFKSFGRPDTFMAGVVLPLAMCAAFGLHEILKIFHHRGTEVLSPVVGSRHASTLRTKTYFLPLCVVILLLFGTLFEVWAGIYPGKDVVATINPFYQQIADDTENYALIQLPFGRNPGKYYLYLQTIHGKPIVEGLASRTPAGAYGYIENNALLTAWRFHQPLDCAIWDAAALEELVRDDFRYVTMQKIYRERFPAWQSYVVHLTPIYDDPRLMVYDLRDLAAQPPCLSPES